MDSLSAGSRAYLPARPALLVVDAEEIRCATLKRALESKGYDVETTGAVRLALSAVVRTQPAVVILGALPPGIPADSVCRQLRSAAPNARPLPIILLDVAAARTDVDRLPDVHTLPVPFDIHRLLGLLRTLIAPPGTTPEPARWVAEALAALPRDTPPSGGTPVTVLDTGVEPGHLLDALEDGVALLDDGGRILWANAVAARLLGAAPGELVGQRLQDLLPDPAELIPGETTGGGDSWLAVSSARADGGVDVCFRPMGDTGAARALATIRDAAPRRRAEQALQSNSDLREQLHRSQKIGGLGRLAGGLAHDFNNLLQVIGGYAEALGGDELDAASRRRVVDQVQVASERAASLTRQLLAFGRRQILVPQVLDLNTTVASLEQMLRRVIGEDIHLVSVLAPDLMRVRVDPGQIEQALLNLALNARDAMSLGGTLELTTANLSLIDDWTPATSAATTPRGDWVIVTVRDTGSGMDAETVAQAFEPFFTTKDSNRGSGLGLSMVYGIVKQSGGYTWIDSAPAAGTSVHVLLPALDVAVASPAVKAPSRTAASDGPRGTVLLVEDDSDVRALFAAFLRHAGHVVLEASDGREALDRFESHGREVDVVVTDVVMPYVSGPALAKALRARKPDMKVLYVSGYNDPLADEAAQDPLTAQLPKPVTRLALLEQVALLLALTSAPPGATR